MILFPRRERRILDLARGGAPKVHDIEPDSRAEDVHPVQSVFTREHWAKALDFQPYLFIGESEEPST